jgi:hypothetical protein
METGNPIGLAGTPSRIADKKIMRLEEPVLCWYTLAPGLNSAVLWSIMRRNPDEYALD